MTRLQPKRQAPAPSPSEGMQSIFDQALAFHRAGLLAEAEVLYRRVLKAFPRSFDCRHLLGVISYQRGDCATAVLQIDAALKIDSRVADAHLNRGNALKKLKRLDEALASYDRAAALKPRDPAILNSRGSVLRELQRFDEALADLDAVIAARPDFSDAFNNRGNVFKDLEQSDAALADYDRAIALKPDNASAFSNRGNLYKQLEQPEQALADYDTAIALKPDHAEAVYNRGTTLMELGQHDRALADFDRAIPLKPGYTEAFYNRGTMLMELGRLDEAVASFNEAIALKPDYSNALWNRALCRLLLGCYREAWADFEWRWRTDQMERDRREFNQPQWTGDIDTAGKRILLHSEQGYGDTIMAARYVRRVAERGAHVILDVPPALAPLMAQIEGISVVTKGDTMPAFDLHCPLMSLPRAFNTTLETIPADVPYLSAPVTHLEKWRQRLPQAGAPRVGINWAGNHTFRRDAERSIGLPRMLPLLSRSDVRFFSIQRDLREGDRDILRDNPHIVHLGDEVETFADTAAIISLLDVVISSDTSVVHLAGALDKPVWILLQLVPDWRWLLDRSDSPWYPTARLFRQSRRDDWTSPLAEVEQALASLA